MHTKSIPPAEELRVIARREHRSVREIGARFIEEGLRQHRFPYYDQKTIPPLLLELATSGGHHSGVVFVDRHSIASENIGMLTQALIVFYDQYHTLVWADLVMFLSPVAR